MKTSTTSVLLVLAAASVSAAMTLQVSAQTYKPRDQTCDNKSTARDKVQRPDQRCVTGTSEVWRDEQAGKALQSFLAANPPQKTTDFIKDKGFSAGTVYDGVNRNGDPYRIVVGTGGGIAGSGSASGLGGNGGGRGGRSAR